MTTLTTERLLLRPMDVRLDLDAIVAYKSLPDVVRYVPYGVQTREDVVDRFENGAYRSELDEPGSHMTLGMVRRDSDELIGEVLLFWRSAEHRGGEIGYIMHPDHHGHGFATEACRELLRYAFDDRGLHRVTARIDERNEASARVLQRLGMRAEARLIENEWFKGEWTTEIDYALLATEWRERQP